MKLTTTHHQGCQPGRARLGACGHLRTGHPGLQAAPRGNRNWIGSWKGITLSAPANFAMGYVGTTTGTGAAFDAITPTTRHLGTRTT